MEALTGGAGVILVLPTTTDGQQGPVAGWISTSGWAAAAERVVGHSWVVTPHGVLDIESLRRRAARPARQEQIGRSLGHAMPVTMKTAVKDAREWGRSRRFRVDPRGPWTDAGTPIEFVWQRHELFHRAGVELARDLDVPLVLFVPALLVWQARQWSVRRPGWGSWLERRGEAPALRAATLVACGTEAIADEVSRLGVPSERVLITPTGVDLDLFTRPTDGTEVRRSLGPDAKFVIGWTGSFRRFHGLEQLVAAAPSLPGTVLYFVGDGPERRRIEELAASAGVRAVFSGTVAHDELPRHLAAMDVGVVLADTRSFHYSPLKVAEYLAAGLAVVAPDVEPLMTRLEAGSNSEVYPQGDVAALRAVLEGLAGDATRCAKLRAGALASAPAWSWDEQVRRVRAAVARARGGTEPPDSTEEAVDA
jgi:glycosyltransferase involved in cell wall biosynthesis